jgi:hypothetical protein
MSQEMAEIIEFGSFSACSQRYIRRSLDIADKDPESMVRYSRSLSESESIAEQRILYLMLPKIKQLIPQDNELSSIDPFIGSLAKISIFDISQGALSSFNEYRFLYERLISSSIRKWLPSVYCLS